MAADAVDYKALNKELSDRIATLEKSANAPDYSRIYKDTEGRTVGFYEPTDETVNFQVGEAGAASDAVRSDYWHMRKRYSRELRKSGYAPWGEFKNFAELCKDGLNSHQTNGFKDRWQKHTKAIAGMSETIGQDGGFGVFPEFSNKIIDRVYGNNLWSRTDNYTVQGNNLTFLANAETSRASGSRHGGLSGGWLGEGGTYSPSKPTIREVSLKLAKVGVVVYLTEELMKDNQIALEQYVSRKVAEELQFMIGDALVNGNGSGQPLGMLNFPSLVSVAKETGQGAATLLPENIVKMAARFFAPNFNSATWYHNQDIQPQLDLMGVNVGVGGQLVYMPPGGLSGSRYATLRGQPMQPTEFNATLGTQGDLLLADMSQILSISKGGIMQAVSMHVEFLTEQVALRFSMRLNAGPWEKDPITPYKGSANTQSNFVVLDTRS